MDIESENLQDSEKCQGRMDHREFFASKDSKLSMTISAKEKHDKTYATNLKDAARKDFEYQMRPLIALSRLHAIDLKFARKEAEFKRLFDIPTHGFHPTDNRQIVQLNDYARRTAAKFQHDIKSD